MSTRQTIDIDELAHAAPIPVAARKGPLLASSAISGIDPATSEMPADLATQVDNLFANLGRILTVAGATPDDVVKLTFFVRQRSARDTINPRWLEMFPDADQRPARHTVVAELPAGVLVQCELLAYCA